MNEDILEFDIQSLSSERKNEKYKIVGNLPYNLTSPILRKLVQWSGWSSAWLMVQKEVGDRLCASPGSSDYGALTVGISLTCVIEPVFDLSENSFDPPPRVTSSVVKLTRRDKPLTTDLLNTQRVIQAAFQQRRKTILNSLSHGLAIQKEKVGAILKKVGVEGSTRPERLTVGEFIQLAQEFFSDQR
jgi:16S rRNA (adenine1518-N6/adenine1519-N6)-dimethyltransferase